MFWKLTVDGHVPVEEFTPWGEYTWRGDSNRLELREGETVRGWTLDGELSDEAFWAAEIAPCTREASSRNSEEAEWSGGYAWKQVSNNGGTLLLERAGNVSRVRVERVQELPLEVAREISDTLHDHEVYASEIAGLIADGIDSRRRAVERLCGLGRELDADRFNEAVWRKTLAGLRLTDIHEQLRAFEVRFDQKYPPAPVSRPENLDEGTASRDDEAMAILRDGV